MRSTSAAYAVSRRAAAAAAASGSIGDTAWRAPAPPGGNRNIARLPSSWRRRKEISSGLRMAVHETRRRRHAGPDRGTLAGKTGRSAGERGFRRGFLNRTPSSRDGRSWNRQDRQASIRGARVRAGAAASRGFRVFLYGDGSPRFTGKHGGSHGDNRTWNSTLGTRWRKRS